MSWAGFGSGLVVFTTDGGPTDLVGSSGDVIIWEEGYPNTAPQSELNVSGIAQTNSYFPGGW